MGIKTKESGIFGVNKCHAPAIPGKMKQKTKLCKLLTLEKGGKETETTAAQDCEAIRARGAQQKSKTSKIEHYEEHFQKLSIKVNSKKIPDNSKLPGS